MCVPDKIKLPDEYNIVRCERCGNCFADTCASQKDYDDYYRNHNYYGNGWKFNSSTYSDKAVIARILKEYVSDSDLIMDMGCGNGQMLNFLKESGFENLVGVDPSETSVTNIIKNGYKGMIGSVYEMPAVNNSDRANVVILAMVLEHLLNPYRGIINLKKNYIKDGGYILLSWPRFEDLMIDESPVTNNFNHEHINYFSVESTDILMARCGFVKVCHHISHAVQHGKFTTFSNVALYKASDISKDIDTILSSQKLYSFDNRTSFSIMEYINRVQDKENVLVESINTLASEHSEVAIWGTGAYMMHLMKVSELSKCNISFFIDNNELKRGQYLFGHRVESPDKLIDFSGTVLITAMLYAEDIALQVRQLGRRCKILD